MGSRRPVSNVSPRGTSILVVCSYVCTAWQGWESYPLPGAGLRDGVVSSCPRGGRQVLSGMRVLIRRLGDACTAPRHTSGAAWAEL